MVSALTRPRRPRRTNYNPFAVVSSIHDTHLTLLLILIVIIFDNWTINVLNLYTGGLSVNNIFEKIGRFWTTLAIGVLGIALSAFPSLVNGYVGQTTALGNLFAPLAGVLLADYLFLRKGRIDVPALYQPHGVYWYWKGANLIAVAWVLAGFGLYFFTPAAWVQTVFTSAGHGCWIPAHDAVGAAAFSDLTALAGPVTLETLCVSPRPPCSPW